MTKTRIIVVIGFVIAFVAGAVVGLQLRTTPVQVTVQPVQGQRPSWLRSELNLSNEQNEQMKAIWEGLHNSGRSYEDRRHRLRDERDEAIAALLSPGVMGDYDRILADFSNKLTALAQERDKAFGEAVEKTKKILTPEQRTKYEEFLKRREPDRGDRGGRAGRHRARGFRRQARSSDVRGRLPADDSGRGQDHLHRPQLQGARRGGRRQAARVPECVHSLPGLAGRA